METTSETILVPLAEGFEEIEAVTIVDVLRRAGRHVTVAGLRPGPVTGGHGIVLGTDTSLDELDGERVAMIVLPGGAAGTERLASDERVLGLVRRLHDAGKPTAAICAAPTVLARAGVLEGARVTSHPSVRERLFPAEVLPDERVVHSGPLVTSQGAGTALEFALALVADLCGPDEARRLAEAMVAAPGAVPRGAR